MARSMFEAGGLVVFEQGKTGRRMVLPVSRPLADAVAAAPAGEDLVICERTGRTYKDYELSKLVAEVREAARLPSHLWLSDLRRTCLNELGRLGATDDQLLSVSGHKVRQTISIYSLLPGRVRQGARDHAPALGTEGDRRVNIQSESTRPKVRKLVPTRRFELRTY
jgi:hypothetical protein